MENETGTSEAHEAPGEQPDVVVSPSRQEEINTSAPDGAEPATGQTAAGPKKRRRGRRGGTRHRRKTPATGAATGEQPSAAAPAGTAPAPKPRGPRPQGQRQPPPSQHGPPRAAPDS